MVKDRREQQRNEEMRELGRANLDVLRKADMWCKHLNAEMTSAGMLAEMWNLPIGSHRITCPHAAQGSLEGMNVRWIARDFLERNCRGCPHHAPEGDTKWGEAVLREQETGLLEHDRRQQDMKRQVEEVRQRLRILPQQARVGAALTEHQILEWAERLFDVDTQKAEQASRRLRDACAVAADLFSEATVSVLVSGACLPPFYSVCLPVVVELSVRRPDLHGRLAAVALSVLQSNLGVENACAILLQTGVTQTGPLLHEDIAQIVAQQRHFRPVGGWPDPDCPLLDIRPVYPHSEMVLARELDLQPDAVLSTLRAALRAPDKKTRINACGAVRGVMGLRSSVAEAMMVPLADALALDDDPYEDSADEAAQAALCDAFFLEPIATDQFLADRIANRTGEEQSLLIGVYNNVLRAEPPECPASGGQATKSSHVGITRAFDRCLAMLQVSSIDIDGLLEVVWAVQSGCRKHSAVALRHFSTLFGTLAQMSLQADAPQPPPRIITLNRIIEHPGFAQLDQHSRQLRWRQIKRELGVCLENLVDASPARTADVLLDSFGGLDSQRHAILKAEVVRLLGILGRQSAILGKVLSPLWVAYMDSSSTIVRAQGIESMGECLGREGRTPPENVAEALLAHLCDPFVIVHRAAVRTVGDNPHWLSPEQSVRALAMLCFLAQTYKTEDRLQLEQIARSLLAVSREYPVVRPRAVHQVVSLLPTGETFVDQRLIELLLMRVNPSEPAAEFVAVRAARWLTTLGDHPVHGREGQGQVFAWLRELPVDLYRKVEPDLCAQAGHVAAEQVRQSCFFASLFGAFANHSAEKGVLEHARVTLPSGKHFEGIATSLATLVEGARLNVNRQARVSCGGDGK
jgi:hypothetical protein